MGTASPPPASPTSPAPGPAPRLDVPSTQAVAQPGSAPVGEAIGSGRAVERALARKRRKYADEVDRLVAAAFRAMRASDTIDPTVGEILAEAGLSTAAFYRHFPAKDDLLLTLLEHAGATTRSYLDHLLARETDPGERIATWVRGMFDLVRSDELVAANRPVLLAHARLVERFPTEIADNTAALVAPLAAAIAEARASRDLPAGEPQVDALLTHRLVYGGIGDRAAERRPAATTEIDAVVSYTVRALLDRG
jgi:AcrR family transcriptional regulator